MRAGVLLFSLVSLTVGSAAVADDPSESARFADGVARYSRGDFPGAMESFRDADRARSARRRRLGEPRDGGVDGGR